MYIAYFSNSLEKMIEDYSSILIPDNIFDNDSVFIIQNRNMEEWLKLKLAELTGVSAGINFQFQDETLRSIINLSPEVKKELETKKTIYLDDLKLIIFHTLRDIFENIEDYTEFKSLEKYVNHEYPLSDGEMKNIKSSRLYRLSDSIAGLFHHYGLNSSEMVRSWERGDSYAAGTEYRYLQGNERWQMRLWNIIFGEGSPYLHPGQIIAGILENRYTLPDVNKKIIIFGSSFLSEQAVEFFYHLSSNCSSEIHHFILSPSPSVLRKGEEKSLLLSQWGNIVTGLAQMLVDKGISIEEAYAESSGERSDLLSCLKRAVFNNQIRCSAVFDPDDSSFRIISVPGRKREIEILKNNIINLIETYGYNFYEIGVAAPDINSYVPYIDSIFRSSDPVLDIPYNLMDVGFLEDSDYLNGFFSLLDLSGARFSRKELFRLFHNRCFMNRFNLSDSDISLWLDICEDLFIKWGFDSSHREDLLNSSSDFATWKKGLERICCGFLFDDSEGRVSFPSGSEIFPYSLEGNYEEKTGSRLFYIVRELYRKIYNLRFSELEIPVWAVRMEMLCDFFLSPVYGTGDDNDRKFLKNVFRQINTLVIENTSETSLSEKPVPFSVYRTLVEEFAGKSGYCRGQYLADGISFSSLKPLRAIPFRVIFLLGMDENSFPGKEKSRNYDLRTLTPKSIDLSVQNTDCFTFLETILSAQEKLFISYTGTDIVKGETLEPSPLVAEIAAMFDDYVAEKIIIKHPLHSYSGLYFSGSSYFRDYISFDRLYYNAASLFTEQKKGKKALLSLSATEQLSDNPEAEISVYQAERFLKYPVSYFLEHVKGIRVNENVLAENDDRESFGLSYGDMNNLNRMIEEGNGEDSGIFDVYLNDGKLSGTLNSSSVSEYECLLSEDEILQFESNLKSGGYFESEPVEIILDEKSIKGESSSVVYPPVKIKADNGVVTVDGQIRGLRRRGNSWFFISYDSVKIRQMISPFFRYLLLRKITGDRDTVLHVFSNSGTPAAVIEDNSYDVDMILEAIAFSYIRSLNSPVTADISCISELVKMKNRINSMDNFIEAADDYYMTKGFTDSRFLNPGSEIAPDYKRDDFYRLFELFYSCLDFKKGGS